MYNRSRWSLRNCGERCGNVGSVSEASATIPPTVPVGMFDLTCVGASSISGIGSDPRTSSAAKDKRICLCVPIMIYVLPYDFPELEGGAKDRSSLFFMQF